MRGSTLAKVAVALLAAATLPAMSGSAVADHEGEPDYGIFDIVFDCNELVPEALTPFAKLAPQSPTITVDVHGLLDGVSAAEASALVAKASEAYTPLNLQLRLVSWDGFSPGTSESTAIIEAAKLHVGNAPPPGAELVHVFTNRDIFADLGFAEEPAVAGQADCVGGLRWPDHAFSLGEVRAQLTEDIEADIVAHEIGHLFGAHHHYANCVEAQCTLMFNDAGLVRREFSSVSAAVVRGHACFYPDDVCSNL